MFSTCLHCHSSLGRNTVVEEFPVGRRLAFDAVRGRLWVVCRRCRNWNLSPLEERWEAVEACERLYRSTTVRVSTDNIGLATISDALDLVRVGAPLRPEFAAWRYGTRLSRRRLHGLGETAASVLTNTASMAVGSVAALVGVGYVVSSSKTLRDYVLHPLEQMEARIGHNRAVAHVRTPEGELRPLRFSHVARLEIVDRGIAAPWTLRVAHTEGSTDFSGAHAANIASQILSRINHGGANRSQIRDATRRITESGDAEQFIRQSSGLRETRRRKNSIFWNDDVGVLGLTATERLALEIAVNEDAERRALQGELEALEAAWRDAEEIAEIADSMFLPESVAPSFRFPGLRNASGLPAEDSLA